MTGSGYERRVRSKEQGARSEGQGARSEGRKADKVKKTEKVEIEQRKSRYLKFNFFGSVKRKDGLALVFKNNQLIR